MTKKLIIYEVNKLQISYWQKRLIKIITTFTCCFYTYTSHFLYTYISFFIHVHDIWKDKAFVRVNFLKIKSASTCLHTTKKRCLCLLTLSYFDPLHFHILALLHLHILACCIFIFWPRCIFIFWPRCIFTFLACCNSAFCPVASSYFAWSHLLHMSFEDKCLKTLSL